MSLVLEANWSMRPKKEQRSVWLFSVGNYVMVSVMLLLIDYPRGVSVSVLLIDKTMVKG